MTRHVGEQHALHTEDEDVWVSFHGEVPRVGDIVRIDDHKALRVVMVRWFVAKWLTEPGSSDEVTLSQARVLVEEVPA